MLCCHEPCDAVVQQGIDKAASDTAACDAKFTTITNEHIAKTEAWQANADRRLDSAEIRLDEAEASLKTKATLEETKDLREKVRASLFRTFVSVGSLNSLHRALA